MIMSQLCVCICVATAICSQSCANGGTCTAPNTCNCLAGWTGQYCTNGKYIDNSTDHIVINDNRYR